MYRLSTRFNLRVAIARLACVGCAVILFVGDVRAATLKEIYALYQTGRHEEAIGKLRSEIVGKGTQYSPPQVDTAFKIIIDCYDASPSYELAGIIRRVASYTPIDHIRTGFSSSTLKEKVYPVLDSIVTPVQLDLTAPHIALSVGQEQSVQLQLLNAYSEAVPWDSCLLLQAADLSWSEMADVDIRDSIILIRGKNPGIARVTFHTTTPSGSDLTTQIHVEVSSTVAPVDSSADEPPRIVGIYPTQGRVGDQVQIFLNGHAPTIQNVSFGDKLTDQLLAGSDTVAIAKVPEGLPNGQQVPIIATWREGTAISSPQSFTVLGKLSRPSRGLFNVGRAAMGVGVAAVIISHLQVRSRLNDYNADPTHSRNLYQRYVDAHNRRNVAIIGTAITSAATYLYYFIKVKPALRKYQTELVGQQPIRGGVTVSPVVADGLGLSVGLKFL